ncbi:MAG: response regulator [Bacteroidetes bacterium]|jgi:DNA-binding response OmpR family regulator|nr:response regulator [Bacteroidota bacterium]
MFLRNLRLLFIDDEPDFVEPLAAYLAQRYQHTTRVVPSMEAAQREVAREPADIIFLDYILPGSSGIEFLRWAADRALETPIIVMSGKGTEDVAVEAMKLGAFDYINKTHVDLDYLPIVINNAYERFVLRRANGEMERDKLARDREELAVKVFQDTVRAFVQRINDDLAHILLRLGMFRKGSTRTKLAQDPDLKQLLDEIEYSGRSMEAAVGALVQLNQTVTKLHDVEKRSVDLAAELDRVVRQLDEQRLKTREADGRQGPE